MQKPSSPPNAIYRQILNETGFEQCNDRAQLPVDPACLAASCEPAAKQEPSKPNCPTSERFVTLSKNIMCCSLTLRGSSQE